MTSVNDYHNMAMEFADLGLRNRARGENRRALAYFEQALDFELAAIAALGRSGGLGWSILHRSAGTLALDCRRFRQAEQITAQALAGEPHPDIADELRDLWEQIQFQRLLDQKGVPLSGSEPVAPLKPAVIDTAAQLVTIRGILRYADAIRDNGDQIGIVDTENGITHEVLVPAGMMNDIVRPMWDARVVITGMRRGHITTLATIDPDDADSSR